MKVQKLTEEQKEEIGKRFENLKNLLAQIDDLQQRHSIEHNELDFYIKALAPLKTHPRISDCGEYLILVGEFGGY